MTVSLKVRRGPFAYKVFIPCDEGRCHLQRELKRKKEEKQTSLRFNYVKMEGVKEQFNLASVFRDFQTFSFSSPK